jgi:phosphoribosylanthranilate isomerase
MTISVKICGISTEEALEAAIDAGADYAGFVFFKRSPRHLSLARAAELARRAEGRIFTVALTVNARYGTLKAIMAKVRPDFLQIHGEESVDRVAAIRRLTRAHILKAIKVGEPGDVNAARVYEPVADLLLFDAKAGCHPGALPGGNGLSFDWAWLPKARLRPNFMLSGGLNSDNVLAALSTSEASAVDVSSGVETSPGVKSPALIRKFVTTAKSFDPAALTSIAVV